MLGAFLSNVSINVRATLSFDVLFFLMQRILLGDACAVRSRLPLHEEMLSAKFACDSYGRLFVVECPFLFFEWS